jgi:hypothetical protein
MIALRKAGETAVNLNDPIQRHTGDDPISWKHSPNEAGIFFHNCRTIEFDCERRDGDERQLVGGGFRICRCYLPLCHGNGLVRALGHRGGRRWLC